MRSRLAAIALAVSGMALVATMGGQSARAADHATLIAQASSADKATPMGQAGTPATASEGATAKTDGSSDAAVKAPESQGHVDVAKLMAADALPDIVIGKKDAPVTIVEYASMTCSHCRDFHQNSYPTIKKEFIDTGKAKLIIREFPFDPRALAAFMLARCAGEGDEAKRTAMVDVLFDQQPQWAYSDQASAELLKISRLAGMSEDQFKACLNDKELQKKVIAVQQRGEKEFGVNATPTFFVNGDKYPGALEPNEMAAVIEAHM
ncbi:thioredoxin domain-containing protein [Jiella sp. CQZ9-1]|uniref:Thioredoxin domain-containing protein n=2 Tax=Jiella flava TaxID=2816857 RepID=A0A939G1J6_9HYPH|nr:thioredoxin domain-containing protein [Jiella flava]